MEVTGDAECIIKISLILEKISGFFTNCDYVSTKQFQKERER